MHEAGIECHTLDASVGVFKRRQVTVGDRLVFVLASEQRIAEGSCGVLGDSLFEDVSPITCDSVRNVL